MSDVAGRWIGRIEGTNSGNFLLELVQSGGEVSGSVRLNDVSHGVSAYEAVGTVADGQLLLELSPTEAMPGLVVTRAKMQGSIQPDGLLRGNWETELGTAGTFVAVREQQLQQGLNSFDPQAAAATAVLYEKNCKVPPCVVDYDTLRQLYRVMSSSASDAFRMAAVNVSGNPDAERTLRLAHSVTILARGESGEQILTLDQDILKQESLPRPLQLITFDLGHYYKLVFRGADAPNRATVTLDFSKPRPIDLSNASGSPTPNRSMIHVIGSGSIWVSGVYQKLLSTIEQNKTGVGFLHSGYVYDALLFTLGLPFVLTFAAVVSHRASKAIEFEPAIYQVAAFLFMLAVALMIFRLAFSFARWLLPYIEFAPQRQPLERRIRAFFAVVSLGILASLGAWVILKALSAA